MYTTRTYLDKERRRGEERASLLKISLIRRALYTKSFSVKVRDETEEVLLDNQ